MFLGKWILSNLTMTDITNETALALIQRDVKYLTTGIDEVKVGIKEINARFATKDEVEERIKQIEQSAQGEIKSLREKISFLEKLMYGSIAFILYQVGALVFNILSKGH